MSKQKAKRETAAEQSEPVEPTPEQLRLAAHSIAPSTRAAGSLAILSGVSEDAELVALITALRSLNQKLAAGDQARLEATLLMQAQVLDHVFHKMIGRAERAEWMPNLETYMRLALKAQNQCRATLQTLAEIRNPPQVAFVRQANIAHGPQQVNNGLGPDLTAPGGSISGESAANPPNKLFAEGHHGSTTVDTRPARTASEPDRVLAPVGTIDRAKYGRG